MGMNINSVRYFLAVCQERSFSGAARQTGVSQPTLSLAIKRLETELKGLLFHRCSSSRTVGLTELGRALHPYFQKLNLCVDQIELAARHRTCTSSPLNDGTTSATEGGGDCQRSTSDIGQFSRSGLSPAQGQ